MKGDKRKQKALAKLEAKKIELGPRDTNWRNTFFRFYGEIKRFQLQQASLKEKVRRLKVQRTSLKDDDVNVPDLDFAINEAEMTLTINRLDIGPIFNEFMKFLGTGWSVKKVFQELDDLQSFWESEFLKSEKGEVDERSREVGSA